MYTVANVRKDLRTKERERERECLPKRNNHRERIIKNPGSWWAFHDIPSAWMKIHRKTMHWSPWNHHWRASGENILCWVVMKMSPLWLSVSIWVSSTKWWVVRMPLVSTVKPPPRLACHLEPVITKVAETANLHASTWPGASGVRWIATKHGHSWPELRTTQGHHMFPVHAFVRIHGDSSTVEGGNTGYD